MKKDTEMFEYIQFHRCRDTSKKSSYINKSSIRSTRVLLDCYKSITGVLLESYKSAARVLQELLDDT